MSAQPGLQMASEYMQLCASVLSHFALSELSCSHEILGVNRGEKTMYSMLKSYKQRKCPH